MQKHPHLWYVPENPKPKTKKCFSIPTRRLAESEDGLNSFLAQSAGELQRCKPSPKFWCPWDLKGFKHLDRNCLLWLWEFYSSCLSRVTIPKIWRKATVIAVLKLNKPMDNPRSYRPTSLFCVSYKLLECLLFRLEPVVDPQLVTQKGGFWRGRSTVQQVVKLTSDIEESYEGRRKTDVVLVDLTADYGTVWHQVVWRTESPNGLLLHPCCLIFILVTSLTSCPPNMAMLMIWPSWFLTSVGMRWKKSCLWICKELLSTYMCFTSPQPLRPKEASDSVSTIRDVMHLTVKLAVCFSFCTQSTVSAARQALLQTPFPTEVIRAQRDKAIVLKIVSSCTSWFEHLPSTMHLHHFYFTSPQPVKPKEAFNSVSTIRDDMHLTVKLAVRFSLHTQCKRCLPDTYISMEAQAEHGQSYMHCVPPD